MLILIFMFENLWGILFFSKIFYNVVHIFEKRNLFKTACGLQNISLYEMGQ